MMPIIPPIRYAYASAYFYALFFFFFFFFFFIRRADVYTPPRPPIHVAAYYAAPSFTTPSDRLP